MLFNSFGFLFVFLPLALAGFFALGRIGPLWPMRWLALASLVFYAMWDSRYLSLLLVSILINFAIGRLILSVAQAQRALVTGAGLAFNLVLLAYYKYAAAVFGWDIILPIGISFFTFTQIAFLVDCSKGKVQECRFVPYLLFVSYFPHLIAGPVLHHADMLPQFQSRDCGRVRASNLALGLSIFTIGLAKKILLADQLAEFVKPVFAAGAHPALIEAWIGVIAYGLQLYFDFSGYSDMAIGLSRLFGIALPENFNAPYKAKNIADFWRRWHMSLSRFLRDYLYIPLGGNRKGPGRRYMNLFITMLLGGVWHGAGLTFLIWGALHGLFLVIQQAWRWPMPAWCARATTLLAVGIAWVFFRAADFNIAFDVLAGMSGLHGAHLRGLVGIQASALPRIFHQKRSAAPCRSALL